jgi:hypothetical protein
MLVAGRQRPGYLSQLLTRRRVLANHPFGKRFDFGIRRLLHGELGQFDFIVTATQFAGGNLLVGRRRLSRLSRASAGCSFARRGGSALGSGPANRLACLLSQRRDADRQ